MIPHSAIDANYIGCQIVNEIYSLKSRLINPQNALIIAVTRIEGGN
jgi:metal-dependent amidase/aminoacylase/carboxypeptidase family protein